jgi:protein-arginine kinase activator protein McsA
MKRKRTFTTQCIKCGKSFERERNKSLVCDECYKPKERQS